MCGTPVVAFNRSASQESLHPRGSILLNDVSVRSLAATILSVCRGDILFSLQDLQISMLSMYKTVNPYTHAHKMLIALMKLREKQQNITYKV